MKNQEYLKETYEWNDLLAIVHKLRQPDGCPWDSTQTPESLTEYVIEECHELVDAIRSGKTADMVEELGDVAFLKAIIDLFSNPHDKSVEDVKAVFEKFGAYVCEEMPEGSDFDEALHFEDPSVDEYYYCVKEEMGHLIYHRFLKEDYRMM